MAKPEEIMARVLSGELSREDAVRRHPEMKDRLLLLTQLTDQLAGLPHEAPSAEFRNAARLRLMRHVQATRRRSPWQALLVQLANLPAWSTRVAAGLALGGSLTLSLGIASGGALPNSRLYGVKLAVNRLQLAFAVGDSARAGAYLHVADQRANELAQSATAVDPTTLATLVARYSTALGDLGATVQHMQAPSPALVATVRTQLASQATELEAQAIVASSHPTVQQALTRAEIVASNAADDVVIVAESHHAAGPADIRLAANPAAVATAVAELQAPSAAAPTDAVSGATLATLSGLYDRAWNDVSAAPFMGHDVRLDLEQAITSAKQSTQAGHVAEAQATLRSASGTLGAAVSHSQATQY
ncbi:MAG: DUF5667 domain-containing protein, partial [Chloroflexota bacterium]